MLFKTCAWTLILFCISWYTNLGTTVISLYFVLIYLFFFSFISSFNVIVLMGVKIMERPPHVCIRATLLHNVMILIYSFLVSGNSQSQTRSKYFWFSFRCEASKAGCEQLHHNCIVCCVMSIRSHSNYTLRF